MSGGHTARHLVLIHLQTDSEEKAESCSLLYHSSPQIEDKHDGEGDQEVEDRGGDGEVERGVLVRLVEGHAAPGALLQVPALVLDVVHLGEDGPGVGGDQAGAPDEEDDLLGPADTGPGVEGERVADGLVPGNTILQSPISSFFKILSDFKIRFPLIGNKFSSKTFFNKTSYNPLSWVFGKYMRAKDDPTSR